MLTPTPITPAVSSIMKRNGRLPEGHAEGFLHYAEVALLRPFLEARRLLEAEAHEPGHAHEPTARDDRYPEARVVGHQGPDEETEDGADGLELRAPFPTASGSRLPDRWRAGSRRQRPSRRPNKG